MKIPFKINDDIIISNNDNGNDVSNGSADRSQVVSPLIKYHLIHHCKYWWCTLQYKLHTASVTTTT